jgi:hypothetical protein
LHELKRYDDALAAYDCAIAVRSDYAEAHQNRGETLQALNRFDEAQISFDRALTARMQPAATTSAIQA